MRRSVLLVAATMALAVLTATSSAAQAAGAVHVFLPEDYDAVEPFAAGEGPCVPWAGSFHEVRHGGYDILLPPGGQVPGEAHLNGMVDGYVELVPDDPTLPTYTGTYREKVNGVFLGTDADGNDVLRVARYGLRSVLTGSDDSRLTLRLAGKVTVDARGRTVVSRDLATCA
jgi:hypothetical protein